ncbi:MAG: DUF1553 domain-containing protein [Pirellulales bacterium]
MLGHRFKFFVSSLCFSVLTLSYLSSLAQGAEDVDFSRDIRPLLSDKCFHCHGPDENHREADLRLDQKEQATGEHDGLWAFKPNDIKESAAWSRISSKDPDEIMPPLDTNKTLTDKERDLIKRWIEQGAQWEDHWAYSAPKSAELPKTNNPAWCHNPIDHFVLEHLEAKGLSPTKEADRATLIRRVSYDLTGLPPSLTDLERFLNDKTEKWYEKMVDHYLATPDYGERMALAWMDASRYGDTSVFHADGPRNMWPWRDWVINAYNENMPFDQFTIEQIAGDLIENATPQQKIASGFNRNHATTDEGGAIAEEWRIDYVVDRVKTTSNVWLGMSLECAQCHDHKYDPFSQKEYYGLFAFFNQTSDPGMQSRKGNQTPTVNVPNAERDTKVASLKTQQAEIDKKIKSRKTEATDELAKWIVSQTEKASSEEGSLPVEGLSAHFELNETKGTAVSDSVNKDRKGEVKGKQLWQEGKFAGGFRVDKSNFIEINDVGDFERDEEISYGCWVKPQGNPSGVPIGKMNEANAHRGWDLHVAGGKVAVHIINTWPTNALKVTTKATIPADKWTHIFATYDGSSKTDGIKIYFDGKEQPWDIEQNGLSESIKSKVPVKIGRRHTTSQFNGIVDDVRIYNRKLEQTEVASLAGNDPIRVILLIENEKRTKTQNETVTNHFFATIDKPFIELTKQKNGLVKNVTDLEKIIVTSMIMGEQAKPRDTFLLMRGHYASPDKSEAIKPAVPSFLPPLPEGAPNNRLGLAKWMVDPSHPMTARVTVNRYWSMIFGRGIVSSVMDFGSQGEWPSHPKLLDWLASDFQQNNWNVKRTLKQILMSATYRQSSTIPPKVAEVDPGNILLARGPRFRLSGESIRDTALSTSGLLVNKVGGPGVRPYQPPGLWNEVSLGGNVRFTLDKGDNLFRKSMYIYWKRSSPHPGMMIFDAPTREKCVVQRALTNTPLQALYTLNGVQFVESARVFGERLMKEGGETNSDKIRFGYRLLTSHEPSDAATKTLTKLYKSQLARFQAAPEESKKLISIGETKVDESLDQADLAAWTTVANVLLNMDAALTKF